MGIIETSDIVYKEVETLDIDMPLTGVDLPNEIYVRRLENVKRIMEEKGIDCLVIYGDKEHYSNFRYLAGYEPRFEEGVMVVHREGINYVMLGNECFEMYKESKIPVTPLLCQIMSLPNQTMKRFLTMEESFREAGIEENTIIGIVGWKLFTGTIEEAYRFQFDIPSYLVEALKNIVKDKKQLRNATPIFISPEKGVRIINDVHSIACFEYGAAASSECLKKMLRNIKEGMTEKEAASYLNSKGLVQSCHSIVASGNNRFRGLISPTDRIMKKGDAFSSCMGMEGGLSSRGGYLVETEEELPFAIRDYLEKVAKPYYAAVASWYETIAIGVTGNELYKVVDKALPQKVYGWVLNPGHLIATEEWLSSFIYPESFITARSGMIVQMDIIPNVEGYSSPGAEDGVCIADARLRNELKTVYPEVWERMQKRRTYMEKELGIRLHEEVLPMSNLAGEYRPFFMNREKALKVERKV